MGVRDPEPKTIYGITEIYNDNLFLMKPGNLLVGHQNFVDPLPLIIKKLSKTPDLDNN